MNDQKKYGLDAKTIQKICFVFQNYSLIQKVILYGSRAKGNYKIGSDIDLVIEGPQLTMTDLLRIENELDDLLIPYKIDISLSHQIENKDLLDHIQRVGITFYPQM